MRIIRGTVSIAVDTNFIYNETFVARYKDVTFKYVVSQNAKTDSIVAIIERNPEYTFEIMSEFVSVLSYARDCGFILRGWCHDQYRGDLALKQPGITQVKMLMIDRQSCSFAGSAAISYECPRIDDEHKSNLVRLYRIARVEEYVNPISAFLYYYHIIDYPYIDSHEHVLSGYINKFEQASSDSIAKQKIEMINANRIFEQSDAESKKYDGTLGSYVKMKVRDSVGHIVRHEHNKAVNLKIDSLTQEKHFYHLVDLLRIVARDKLSTQHQFNVCCDRDIFCLLDGS